MEASGEILQGNITKFGNGAHIIIDKNHIAEKAIIIIKGKVKK